MKIRLGRNEECHLLPAIETSAGRLFADIGMHDVANEAAPPAETWEPHCASETLWVAVDDRDQPYAFLAAGQHDEILFVYELAVARDHQRQGVGRALMAAAAAKAAALGLEAVYLTTFCDVPFNAPYYAKLGYHLVEDKDLPPVLQPVMAAERLRWSAADRRRCAMIKPLAA